MHPKRNMGLLINKMMFFKGDHVFNMAKVFTAKRDSAGPSSLLDYDRTKDYGTRERLNKLSHSSIREEMVDFTKHFYHTFL